MGIKPDKDLESGKSKEDSKSNSNFGKLAAMFFAAAVLAGASAVAYIYFGWQISLIVASSLLVICVILFNYRWIYVASVTAPRDLTALYHYGRMNLLTRKLQKNNWAMADIFHQLVVRHPNKPCFLFENETWTFKQVEDHSLRVSAALKAAGVKPGGVIGLMLSNCPDYPAIWLGANRINCITALMNTNQSGTALLHSINVAKCDLVIYGAEFENEIQEVKKEISSSAKLFKYSRKPLNTNQTIKVAESENDFISLMESVPTPVWGPAEGAGFNGKLLYIYTSGTTGLPKAAIISSSRMVFMASGVHYLGGLSPKDVIYCPMPLYHSAGGCISMGQALVFGCTVALRTKFSASNYFPDCIKFKATAAHYIGEMCRYVLSSPPAPTDTQHQVKTVYGNGMRPAIWRDFVTRFNIKKVAEFYGATEGNANIVNVDNKEGAVGFVSRIIPAVYPISLIKVDDVTGEPIRDKKGLCQLAKANEPGAFVGKINQANPARAYLGYVDKQASEKKVIRDVFTLGDSAFISGDILVADELGYLYFKDRTGDTFRWRGENVSTSEVEAIVSRCAEQRDAVVYGVEVPNTEGRAGMCGIVDKEGTLDMDQLLSRISKDLPAYARPVFIRVMTAMEMTGTFKMRKVDLQKEGYDPSKITDKIYYLDPKEKKYLPLDSAKYDKIMSGDVRL